ncbi:hypothetical protein E2C01_088263 [Portunus trituberculatus]|uniref:Uncharacterized protein n=1 Tax=Portunus trituberculatus TaxID=210409 RepID=A0A5B7J5N8_PORTR|nr:hypothetical protein [Portunus trituberculatus]
MRDISHGNPGTLPRIRIERRMTSSTYHLHPLDAQCRAHFVPSLSHHGRRFDSVARRDLHSRITGLAEEGRSSHIKAETYFVYISI